jgi:hypothetical protein
MNKIMKYAAYLAISVAVGLVCLGEFYDAHGVQPMERRQ